MLDRPAITTLLGAVVEGDASAHQRLYELVYDELKRIARGVIRNAGPLTMRPSTLVHEAYLRLAGDANREHVDSNHFYSLLARAMRQVIVDVRRSNASIKRGDGLQQIDLTESVQGQDQSVDNLLEIEKALQKLEAIDPELGDLVELHFFGGFSFLDIARFRGVNERTVRRHWESARAFLLHYLPEMR